MSPDPRLWAITTYFNPSRYVSRKNNYDIFRRFLSVPLCTVEHSLSGEFELGRDDAEILLQISSPDTLWQKERLLNLALRALPREAELLVWTDCDVVFPHRNWHAGIPALLDQYAVAQCLSAFVNLSREQSCFEVLPVPAASQARPSFAWTAHSLGDSPRRRRKRRHQTLGSSPGGAWAAKRKFIEKHGFYDHLILGGGDRAFACACIGYFAEAVQFTRLKGPRAAHYLAWAQRVFSATRGRIGFLDGPLLHLWHGSKDQRGYLWRHEELDRLNFQPNRHLALAPSGAWQWSPSAPGELRAAVRSYFESRSEDGESPA